MRKLILLVFCALLMVGGTVLAQDDAACGGLSPEDCTLLNEASAALSTATESDFDFTFDIVVGEMEGSPAQTITVTGSGAYDISGVGEVDPAMMSTDDPAAALSAMGEAISGFSGDLTINITDPASGETLPIELVLIEGIGYLNFDPIVAVSGESAGLPTGWQGIDLVEAIEQLAPLAAMSMDMESMEDMEGMEDTEAATEGEEAMTEEAMAEDDMMAADTSGYITIARSDEGGLAVFTTTIDFAAIAQDPAFEEALRQQLESQGQGALSDVLVENADGIVLTTTTTVDPATNTVTSVGFDLLVSSEAAAAFASASGAGAMETAPEIGLNAVLNYTNIGNARDITVPEGANVVPFEELMGLLMGGGMGSM